MQFFSGFTVKNTVRSIEWFGQSSFFLRSMDQFGLYWRWRWSFVKLVLESELDPMEIDFSSYIYNNYIHLGFNLYLARAKIWIKPSKIVCVNMFWGLQYLKAYLLCFSLVNFFNRFFFNVLFFLCKFWLVGCFLKNSVVKIIWKTALSISPFIYYYLSYICSCLSLSMPILFTCALSHLTILHVNSILSPFRDPAVVIMNPLFHRSTNVHRFLFQI